MSLWLKGMAVRMGIALLGDGSWSPAVVLAWSSSSAERPPAQDRATQPSASASSATTPQWGIGGRGSG